MKTYSEKLRDPRWFRFREQVFLNYGTKCFDCGDFAESRGNPQVHHLRYFAGREPWEYSMDDVRVVCNSCHDRIHLCESTWRDLIRQLPPWAIAQFEELAEEIGELDGHGAQAVAVACKSLAREYKQKGRIHGR